MQKNGMPGKAHPHSLDNCRMEFARWIDSEANREEGGEHVNVGAWVFGCGVIWGSMLDVGICEVQCVF